MEFTFKAIPGQQWGKETYTASIPFIQLGDICRVDPDVQRKADKGRMDEIAQYIYEGLTGKRFMAGFNSIVTSLRYSSLKYNEDISEVRISTRGKLYINDGQHRVGGIIKFVERVESELESATNNNDTEAMKYWQAILEQLEEMKIPVLIFTNLTKEEEQQLFHDLNNLGVQVNQTQALKLDQNDKFNRIAKQLSDEITYVKRYGINTTAKTLSEKNKELATLGTWNYCMRILLNGLTDKEMKQPWNEEWDFEEKKKVCFDFWNEMLKIMPEDFIDKEKYMITKAAYLQGIAAFGHKLIFEDNITGWRELIGELSDFDWGYKNDVYSKFGGGSISVKKNKAGQVVEKYYFKGTRAAIISVSSVLREYVLNQVNGQV